MVVWDAEQLSPSKILFKYLSKDGEEGFPGNLSVEMTYELTDADEFIVTHMAKTDKRTPVNLTHHSFFNLHGFGEGTINDHILTINAGRYTPVNDELIPTGEVATVEGTPMDFRKATEIGLRADADFEQLTFGRGYDHNWVLDKKKEGALEQAAVVYEPKSGIVMEVLTTEPAMQFYGGNFFDGKTKGKEGKPLNYRASFALETQHYPDSPNHPNFPSTILSPGEKYEHVCIYKFGVK
jgi:aldose 1-epimerase